MTAPKKNTSKSAKSPAPATKSVVKSVAPKPSAPKSPVAPVPPARKAPAKKTAAPASAPAKVAPAAPAAPVIAPVPMKPIPVIPVAPAPEPAPVVQPVVSQPVATVIQARIDIGFGNLLHIRGEGAGLSWDEGKRMDCVADDLWQITLPESSRTLVFKFLVNDLSWNTGPDYTVAGGTTITLTPEF